MSKLEEALYGQLKFAGFPEPVREYRFAPPRRWRADFAYPDALLLIEVEGGTWVNGRHSRGSGFEADCDKYNEAALLGWRVVRLTEKHIKSGEALLWIERGLGDNRSVLTGEIK